MKKRDIQKLKNGDTVIHKHYGECTVAGECLKWHDDLGIELGIGLYPILKKDRKLCYEKTGYLCPFIEKSFRLIQNKID
jgi:hypothetical protein